MLKFLAREQANVHTIEKLVRKTEDAQNSLGRIKLARAAAQTAEYVVGVRGATKMECHLGNTFDRLEIRAAMKNIVSEVEEKFEISSLVQKTLERIVRKIEALDCKRRAVHRRGEKHR